MYDNRTGRQRAALRRVGAPGPVTLLIVLAAFGCDGPTGPDYALEVTPADITLETLADSVVVTATYEGEPVADFTLFLSSEQRGVDELRVLSMEALGRGVVKPAGPGRAVLTVKSSLGDGRMTVRVAPPGPTVFEARSTSRPLGPDTVTLLGSGLGQVPMEGGVLVGGEPVTLLTRTATSLRFIPPVVAQETCSGAAPARPVEVPGAAMAAGLSVALPRSGEIRLERGGYVMLGEHEELCLRLPAHAGQYILAYADLRQEVAGRTGWAGFGVDPYVIEVGDRTVAASGGEVAGAAARARAAGDGAPHVRWVQSSGHAPCSDTDFTALMFWCRSTPWAVGDTMRIRKPGSMSDTITATVWKVYGGRFAFAVADGDDSENLRAFKSQIESAMPAVQSVSVPLFQTVFGASLPATSVGSGQLLTIIGDFQHSSVGGGCCGDGSGPWAVVTLGSWHASTSSEIFYLLTHEFAHTWQMRWYYDTRPAGGSQTPTPTWGIEGGADLLALEAVRRRAGVPWGANRTFDSLNDAALPEGPLYKEIMARGDIFQGYEQAASFLRDVVGRMTASGASLDDAYAAAALGALEDWHGFDFDGVKRGGLTGRVRAHLPTWEPGAGLLLYTLTQGADELTTNVELQNPLYAAVGSQPLGAGFGSAGLVAGTDTTLVFARGGTSTGLLRLEDAGAGSSFLATSSRPHTGWAVVRIR